MSKANNTDRPAPAQLKPPFLVYLYDTNRRELFDKDQRALAHG